MNLRKYVLYGDDFYYKNFKLIFPKSYWTYLQRVQAIRKMPRSKKRNSAIWGINKIIHKNRKKLEAAKKRKVQPKRAFTPDKNNFYHSKEWRELRKIPLTLFENECFKCGIKLTDKSKLHVDHIKPVSLYPELKLDLENLQLLCEHCNTKKGTSVVDYRTADHKRILEIYILKTQ